MVPVIIKISKKEAFSSNDILLDFLRGKGLCVCVCVWGGVKILYDNILTHPWISAGNHK